MKTKYRAKAVYLIDMFPKFKYDDRVWVFVQLSRQLLLKKGLN